MTAGHVRQTGQTQESAAKRAGVHRKLSCAETAAWGLVTLGGHRWPLEVDGITLAAARDKSETCI